MSGLVKALSQLFGGSKITANRSTESEGLPSGDILLRGGVLLALGPEAGGQLLRELDYGDRVRHLEAMRDLRRRELALQADLESLR